MVLVPVPWAQRVWALPFLTVLCWPPKSRRQRRHKTSVDWVRQMMKQVRRWLPGRAAGVSGRWRLCRRGLGAGVSGTARDDGLAAALDAALYHPPAPPSPGKRGRKPTKGKRQRSLKVWAARSDTPWEDDGRWTGTGASANGSESSRAPPVVYLRARPRWRSALSWCGTPRGKLHQMQPSCVPTSRHPRCRSWVG